MSVCWRTNSPPIVGLVTLSAPPADWLRWNWAKLTWRLEGLPPFWLACILTVIIGAVTLALPIAVAGAVGYIVNGLHAANLPPWSLGFVYLPALAAIVGCSVLTAPLGARLAHSLPVGHLKRGFAVLLLVMGTKLLTDLLR